MSDQGMWFKLWCSALDDTDLDNLDIADFGRWAKFGGYVKKHGEGGSVTITSPARTLCSMLQVPDFSAFHLAVSRFPNVKIEEQKLKHEGETTLIVTICNWMKYQGDFSTQRVRKFREMKRSRGEEKRGEENVSTTNVVDTTSPTSKKITPESLKKQKIEPALPQEAVSCAEQLHRHVASIPKARQPTSHDLRAWAHDFEKLHRIDGRTWEDIHSLLAWSCADQFWRTNILSGSKFREQWNQLAAKMSRIARAGPTAAAQGWKSRSVLEARTRQDEEEQRNGNPARSPQSAYGPFNPVSLLGTRDG